MKIIGLSGKAGVGKDYIAKMYLRGLGYLPIALADSVKELSITQGRCTYEEAFVTKPAHARTALQQVGTEEGRLVWGEDCWCRTLQARMLWMSKRWGVDKFVITDVRFLNEVHFVQEELRGEVYRIYAPDRNALAPLTAEQRTHESETALDMFDPDEDALALGLLRFRTSVVEVRNGRTTENSLYDAVIDNRIGTKVSLDDQLTQILRIHDHIPPDHAVYALPE